MSLLAPVSSAPPVPPAALSVQSLQAEVVGIARLVPFEAGVDTRKKPKRRTGTIQGTTSFIQSAVSWFCFFSPFPLLFFSFSFSCQGGEGVFGRALTKRAWMPPNQPEEKNKTNEKARKEEKGAGGAGGGQGVR